jgi:hypothetical protein
MIVGAICSCNIEELRHQSFQSFELPQPPDIDEVTLFLGKHRKYGNTFVLVGSRQTKHYRKPGRYNLVLKEGAIIARAKTAR